MKLSINDLIKMADTNSNTAVSAGSSKYSVSIVNNTNGKRISISKALSEKLELADTAFFLPVESAGDLLISTEKLSDKVSVATLGGKDKKICYNAALVSLLTASFKLDFENKTSCSFNNIEFDTVNGAPVAIVHMNDATVEEGGEVNAEA